MNAIMRSVMTSLKLFLILTILIHSTVAPGGYHEEAFSRHIETIAKTVKKCYRTEYNTLIYTTQIKFAKLEKPVAGVCYRIFSKIEIDKEYFKSLNYHEQVELLFHEIGHCVFGYPHEKAPSIMQPQGSLGFDFIWNYSKYVSEFFARKKTCDITWHEVK
jgi:hypothetical protein